MGSNKYRKKPVVIEAIQLTETTVTEVYNFIHRDEVDVVTKDMDSMTRNRWIEYAHQVVAKGGMPIKTLESDGETQVASLGDYVIRGVKGEVYPCKPDVFELTYDKVEVPQQHD